MKSWYAIYTKPRAEKKTAERLEKQGMEVYCPTQTTMRQWSDRKKKVQVPVFPSYVFVKVAEKERIEVLETPGVVQFVYWLGQPASIRDTEIESIRSFLGEYEKVEYNAIEVSPGMRVKIKEGSLKDNEGIIKEIKKNRVVLRLERVGFELSAEVHLSKLRKV